MGTFQDSDLKQLVQLIALLKRAHFKEMTAPEAMTVTNVIHWVSSLKTKMELDIANDKKPASLDKNTTIEEPKKKVKK